VREYIQVPGVLHSIEKDLTGDYTLITSPCETESANEEAYTGCMQSPWLADGDSHTTSLANMKNIFIRNEQASGAECPGNHGDSTSKAKME
jgi:hypothetical protein